MQYIKGLENYNDEHFTAITIGKFDGLHLGHEMLIQKVREHQEKDNVKSVVLTFDVSCVSAQKNMMSSEERRNRLEDKVDYLVECTLDEQISHMEAKNFIKEILVDKFHIKYIVVGEDFRFGYQKQGDYKLLAELGKSFGYQVDVVQDVCYDNTKISSTYIRELLEKEEYALAEKLLGHSIKKL